MEDSGDCYYDEDGGELMVLRRVEDMDILQNQWKTLGIVIMMKMVVN